MEMSCSDQLTDMRVDTSPSLKLPDYWSHLTTNLLRENYRWLCLDLTLTMILEFHSESLAISLAQLNEQ